jgi:hypothetical protein
MAFNISCFAVTVSSEDSSVEGLILTAEGFILAGDFVGMDLLLVPYCSRLD